MKQTSKFQDDSTSCIIFNVLSGAIKNEFKINYCTLKEKTFFSQRMMLINVKQLTKLSTNWKPLQNVNVIINVLKVGELTFSPNETSLKEYIVIDGVMVIKITLFGDDPITI